MKTIRIIIISIISQLPQNLLAQDKVIISYENITNLIRTAITHHNLYFNKDLDKSLYIRTDTDKTDDKVIEKQPDGNVYIYYKSSIASRNYFMFAKDSLLSISNYKGKYYLIGEVSPRIDWKFHNEEKTIDNIILKKATCTFRGRNYIAWFSPEIPIKAGPWKFHSLPGLIFEINDDSQTYNWRLTKIKYENFSDTVFDLDMKEIEKISIREYVEIMNASNDMSKVLSKLPKGVRYEKGPSNRRELKFEWEEQ